MMPRLVDPGADLVGKTKRPDADPSEPYRADKHQTDLQPARQAAAAGAAGEQQSRRENGDDDCGQGRRLARGKPPERPP